MAVMSVEERQEFFKRTRLSVKTKCDHCGTPITSTLSYGGTKGREYCQRSCLAQAEPTQVVHSSRKDKPMTDEAPKTTEAPAKKKGKAPVEVPVAKTKKAAKEDAAPATKKKAAKEEAPAAKTKKAEAPAANATSKNPFRAGSAIAKAFDLCYAGTTRAKLKKFCEDQEIGATRVFACMKAGAYGDRTWKYKEDEDGSIKVVPLKKKSE